MEQGTKNSLLIVLAIPRPDSAQSNWRMKDDLSPDEVKLRTIKKGRGGPVFSTLGKSRVNGWKAVQDAIG